MWLSSACLAQSPLRRRPMSHSGDKHVFSSLTTKLVAQVRPPNHRLKTEDMHVFPCLGNSPVHVLRKQVYGWVHCCSDLCCVLLCSPCCEATSVCLHHSVSWGLFPTSVYKACRWYVVHPGQPRLLSLPLKVPRSLDQTCFSTLVSYYFSPHALTSSHIVPFTAS